jgi:serine/threonine-protein phosphatase 2A regulatory subunit B''
MEQSLHFFWPIIDIDKKGYLTPFTINFFLREIMKKLQKSNGEVVNVGDVCEEIYSMVTPEHKLHITLQDLINCKCGGTVVGMLIDVELFWAYDNREGLAQHSGPS